MFDLLGLSIPVYEGAASPIVRDDFPVPREILHKAGSVHGRELPIPKPRSAKQSQRAVEFLVETYMAATEPIALVPVGPLTNVAMAIKLEPRIVDRIPETIIMGGGHEVGNTTPVGRVQHLGRPGSRARRLRGGAAERGGHAARCHPPGPGLAR